MLRGRWEAALGGPGGLALAASLVAGCASGGIPGGPPLTDPAEVARGARAESGADRPVRIRFRWEYGDENGRLGGDGVARINPPDSFRLDLFTTGEGSMAVVMADDSLSTLGEIRDVELPSAPLLYAMAGVFRPGAAPLAGGRRAEAGVVLEYDAGGTTRLFQLRDDRLVRVEERDGSRLVRRIAVEWPDAGDWPRRAEFRDLEAPRRVTWDLQEVQSPSDPFPTDIYDLDGRR